MPGRILRWVWRLWVYICIGLLVFALLEGLARVASAVHRRSATAQEHRELEELLRAGATDDTAWVSGYVREAADLQSEWRSYVYWRMAARHGRYINVDRAGIRHTWNPTPSPSPDQLKIFMFGGSAMWGIGARDEFTIPSLVSKKLAHPPATPAWITNFGQLGWVNTQEVIALMLELQRGNIPDIAVFYDSSNDIFSAFQSGIAGIPQNELNRTAEFNVARDADLRPILLRRLAVFRWIERAVRAIGGEPLDGRLRRRAASGELLAASVVDVYVRNFEVVDALASRFGFKARFFWQPTLPTKSNRSPEEQREMSRPRNTQTAELVGQVHKALRERIGTGRYPHIHELSGVFGNDGRMYFLDAVHLLEAGNERVADAMVQRLRDVTKRASRP